MILFEGKGCIEAGKACGRGSCNRVTGVGIFLFLLVHILDTSFLLLGPELYNRVMQLYRHPLFLVGEVVLLAMVLYHALNGVRIIIVDFWPESTVLQRGIFCAVMALFTAIFVPSAYVMLGRLFE